MEERVREEIHKNGMVEARRSRRGEDEKDARDDDEEDEEDEEEEDEQERRRKQKVQQAHPGSSNGVSYMTQLPHEDIEAP